MLGLAATATRRFTKLKDVEEVAEGVYCTPASPNLAAVDALMQPSMLFQMTVTQKREEVDTEGLARAVDALRPTPEQPVRFYFVVPSAEWRLSGGLFDACMPLKDMQGVEQWVLEVPIVQVGARAQL